MIKPTSLSIRALALALLSCCFWLVSLVSTPDAIAVTTIKLSDLSYHDCPPELAEGSVTAGGSAAANCFIITGTTQNDSGKPVYNADIFGRVYDANNNSVMQNRTRLGSIEQVEPGAGTFELRISVPANQPTPLQLKQFKASGFAGKVRR